MNLSWLTDLRRGPDRRLHPAIQLVYLVALLIGAVLFAFIAAGRATSRRPILT